MSPDVSTETVVLVCSRVSPPSWHESFRIKHGFQLFSLQNHYYDRLKYCETPPNCFLRFVQSTFWAFNVLCKFTVSLSGKSSVHGIRHFLPSAPEWLTDMHITWHFSYATRHLSVIFLRWWWFICPKSPFTTHYRVNCYVGNSLGVNKGVTWTPSYFKLNPKVLDNLLIFSSIYCYQCTIWRYFHEAKLFYKSNMKHSSYKRPFSVITLLKNDIKWGYSDTLRQSCPALSESSLGGQRWRTPKVITSGVNECKSQSPFSFCDHLLPNISTDRINLPLLVLSITSLSWPVCFHIVTLSFKTL